MSSSQLTTNIFTNRFQALSGLPNLSILPKNGFIYSSENINILFDKSPHLTPWISTTITWTGKIHIEVLNVSNIGELYEIESKISFENTVNNEIIIPDIHSTTSTTLGIANLTNVIDLITNSIKLKYSSNDNDTRSIVIVTGNLFLSNMRIKMDITYIDKSYNYSSSIFIILK